MKIGLSFSRCVREIVEGIVDINDVLIIIARTDFDPRDDKQWKGIWDGYTGGALLNMNMEWGAYDQENAEHEQMFRDVAIELWEEGKLHQPRKFGAYPRRRPEIWLETVLPSSELDKNQAARSAWDKFQTVAGLTNVTLDKDYK